MNKREAQRLLNKVEQYFKGVEHTVTTQDLGHSILVDVSYKDFRKAGQVRHDLHLLDPNIVVGELDRYYSRYALKNAFGLMAAQWLEARCIDNGIPDMPELT